MENATKALLMAAGVLIGIVILSLGVYLYGTIGNYVQMSQEEMNNQALIKFNTQFYNYTAIENQQYTFQDIITIANIAYENNSEKELLDETESSYGTDYVDVIIIGATDPSSGIETGKKHLEKIVGDSKQLEDWLAKNYSTHYTCKAEDMTVNSANRVNKIVFRKVND